jgi:hypothetical protein
VICFSILITALYIGSRGNLFLCIVMHWMINAAQQVCKEMFPDVRDQGLGYVAVQLVVLAVITGLAAAYIRSRKAAQGQT